MCLKQENIRVVKYASYSEKMEYLSDCAKTIGMAATTFKNAIEHPENHSTEDIAQMFSALNNSAADIFMILGFCGVGQDQDLINAACEKFSEKLKANNIGE